MASIGLKLLGGFEVTLAPGTRARIPTRKAQALLAYLAVSAGRPVARDTLAGLLWSDSDDSAARNNLRQTLFVLRKALGDAAALLDVDAATVCLSARASVDVADFERDITDPDPERLSGGIARYRAELLAGLAVDAPAYDDWLVTQRERLRELLHDGLRRLIAHDVQTGNLARALETARRGLALDPLDEAMHREVMRLHASSGRPLAALRQYQVCVDALQRELGIEPDAETRALYRGMIEERRGGTREETPAALSSDISIIGRESEVERLTTLLDATARGQGRVVAILGEAGIGKSRLTRELAAEMERRDGRVVTGACHDAERTLPLHPWVEALRRGGLGGQVSLSAWPAPVQNEILRLFPEIDPDRIPGAPREDSALQLFEGLTRLVTGVAAARPLLVVIEDAHWADTTSLRFLAFLARRIERAPILVAITAREEDAVDVPLLGRILDDLEREQRLTRIALAPLTRGETDRLVRAHARAGVGDAALAALRQAVWGASGGNPFVAVEMVQAFRHGAASPPLPRKVHELIADRLGRLSERAQELAALVALMAGGVDFALLAGASGLTPANAADGLEELVRRRVLHAVDTRFAFVHDRVRDVTLQRLIPPRRRLLHRRIANAAETLYAGDLDAHAATLGSHCLAAELWDRALPYLRRAGRQALATGSHREAAARFEQAVNALSHLPTSPDLVAEAIDLRIDLRHALIAADAFEPISKHLIAAERDARALGDRARLGRVLALRANCHFNFAEYGPGREACAQAEVIARELGDRTVSATVRMYLGMFCHQSGDHATGAEHYRRFLREANEGVVGERLGLGLTLIYARAYLCICLSELGEFAEGYAVAEEAIRRADAVRHPWALAHASLAMSTLAARQGRPERALATYAWYRQALSAIDDVWPLADAWAAYCEVLAGRAEEALPRLDPANTILLTLPAIQLWRAEACVQLGRLREARALATEALERGRTRGEASYEAWGHFTLGEIAERGGARGSEAEQRYEEALELARKRGYRPLEARARLRLGEVRARAGRADAADDIEAARALLTELGMTRWLETAAASAR